MAALQLPHRSAANLSVVDRSAADLINKGLCQQHRAATPAVAYAAGGAAWKDIPQRPTLNCTIMQRWLCSHCPKQQPIMQLSHPQKQRKSSSHIPHKEAPVAATPEAHTTLCKWFFDKVTKSAKETCLVRTRPHAPPSQNQSCPCICCPENCIAADRLQSDTARMGCGVSCQLEDVRAVHKHNQTRLLHMDSTVSH